MHRPDQAIDLGRAFEQRRIEPATAARAPGGDAFSAPTVLMWQPGVPSFPTPARSGMAPTHTGAIGLVMPRT